MKSFFEPPLWFERRTLILKILNKHKDFKKVIDYGCNVGNLLEVLKNNSDYEEIIAVDNDENVLKEAYEKSKVTKYFMVYLKTKPLNIKLLKGNIKYADVRLLNSDALICSEVIEHLDNETLEIFPKIVFNIYKPKVVIITTPNCEFNYYFKELNYGTPQQKFRHEEHLFEWTRKEFNLWVKNIAEKYNYKFEITGIGSAPKEIVDGDRGYCTQIAIFERIEQCENNSIKNDINTEKLTEIFDCLYNIDYPYFDNSNVSVDEILKELVCFSKNYIDRIKLISSETNDQSYNENQESSDKIISNYTNISENTNENNSKKKYLNEENSINKDESNNKISTKYQYAINLEDIWQDYYINRLCGNKEKLKKVLKSDEVNSIFFFNNDENQSTDNENNNTEKVYIRNIDDLYDCFDKYYNKEDYESEYLSYSTDDDYNNKTDKYNEYSDTDKDSFWDHYSDSYHDNYSDAEHNF
ncbi:hypothetical protein H8356DRAFT_1621207 [Neocallimastix lanati (nom. inval.)]|jgi:hypothetical protein|uniref:Small RNA 2'-O-methyltransferase n=1 Tax=Neocallimastix californiae TaxID=1754190 RepID=A0A1Y2C919_9FUNG|nr:hypothetical protein H8356DRAFT_1621207 [Neocallimastix sp. JGI-2020a]ORY43531.1 hypothetical protein LY90DRAFT_671713 [Neocallimastix californiae]|eukprot:ORY43531.1 hypothetical protein LY90DRAFT_671713 [Neocallimastix californiae]